MCKLLKFALVYLFLNLVPISCSDEDYTSVDDYDLFEFLEDDKFEKLVNYIDAELIDLNQKVDNAINDIDQFTIRPLESSLIHTTPLMPNRNFLSAPSVPPRLANNSEYRKKMINTIEKQIKKDLNNYKFTKANRLVRAAGKLEIHHNYQLSLSLSLNRLVCLRRHLLVEHDRLNELEKFQTYQTVDQMRDSLSDHISWFTNYSAHLLAKENRPVEEEYIDGNGLVDLLVGLVNKKIIYPHQPYKIKKNKNNVVYSLKPFVILDATIGPKNASQKVSLLRASPFFLKNDVNNKFYLLRGNVSLELVLKMRNQFELLYNYVFNTTIETNLIGSVEVRYFYEEFKLDITVIEIADFEHFDVQNNFGFFQGMVINPVLNTVKGRIMEAIRVEANKFLKKVVAPIKMKNILEIIK